MERNKRNTSSHSAVKEGSPMSLISKSGCCSRVVMSFFLILSGLNTALSLPICN